jgi:mannose-6-phosphate isomerase-like protein (cupin superfamily)
MDLQLFYLAHAADQAAEMEFVELGNFDAGAAGVFWSNDGGPSPWEMHPDCDELLHVIEGEIDIEVLPVKSGNSERVTLMAGGFLIVPRGCWHRQTIRGKSKEFYLTPGQTLHSHADDPRFEP